MDRDLISLKLMALTSDSIESLVDGIKMLGESGGTIELEMVLCEDGRTHRPY